MTNLCCLLSPFQICTKCNDKWCDSCWWTSNSHCYASDFVPTGFIFVCPNNSESREEPVEFKLAEGRSYRR